MKFVSREHFEAQLAKSIDAEKQSHHDSIKNKYNNPEWNDSWNNAVDIHQAAQHNPKDEFHHLTTKNPSKSELMEQVGNIHYHLTVPKSKSSVEKSELLKHDINGQWELLEKAKFISPEQQKANKLKHIKATHESSAHDDRHEASHHAPSLNSIAHSKSPELHKELAAATKESHPEISKLHGKLARHYSGEYVIGNAPEIHNQLHTKMNEAENSRLAKPKSHLSLVKTSSLYELLEALEKADKPTKAEIWKQL